MNSTTIDVWDQAAEKPIPAELCFDITRIDLAEAEILWNPYRLKSVVAKLRSGDVAEEIPQHYHWNWFLKSGDLKYLDTEVCGIKVGEWQGLMMTSTAVTHQTRLEGTGKQLVYVKYLESAPWNVKGFTAPLGETPKYGAIGTRLLEVAVRRSLALDLRGRVGLHSLPNEETEGFYRRRGMQSLGPDPQCENLPYYEFSEPAAKAFLEGEV